jgi:hypothetical protein
MIILLKMGCVCKGQVGENDEQVFELETKTIVG